MRAPLLLLLVLCLQCGGQTQATPPTEEPPAPPAAEPPPAETAAPEASAAPTAEAPAASATPDAPASKPCSELPQKKCEVTKGCAWNSLKKCVSEGP